MFLLMSEEYIPDLIGLEPDETAHLTASFDPERTLSREEIAFVAAIINGNTQSTAYNIANPSYKGAYAYAIGSSMANRPHVKKVLDAELDRARIAAKSHATKHVGRVLDEYLRIAFVDPSKLLDNTGRPLPLHEIDEDTRRAIIGVDIVDEFEGRGDARQQIGTVKKYKLADKQKALDSLSKMMGLLVEKTEITGKDGKDLVPEVTDNDLARRIAFILQKAGGKKTA